MAIRGMEDWDTYAVGDIPEYWQGDASNSSIVNGAGRCGTAAYRNQSVAGAGPFIGVQSAVSSGYVGWAYEPESFGATRALEVGNASLGVLGFLVCNADGSISAWKGVNTVLGTLIGSTPVGMMSLLTYGHIGLEFKWDAATGYFKIYVNGVKQYDSGGVNTTNGFSSGQWNLITFTPRGYIDDCYWGDTAVEAGNPWNAFLGDCRVEGAVPLSDSLGGGGFYQQWTPSSGTDFGALVNAIPPNGGATYVASGTIGQKQTFIFPNLSVGAGTVYAVQAMPNMVKDVPGGRQVATLLRSAAADALGQNYGPAQTNYKYYPQVLGADIANGNAAWNIASVNAAQLGVEITG